MKTIKQTMQQAGKWPRDPRQPIASRELARHWKGRPFPFPVDKFGHRS
jgi:hypothetical protein